MSAQLTAFSILSFLPHCHDSNYSLAVSAISNVFHFLREDLSSSALEEAKEQWEKSGKPFVARFCELNPCMVVIFLPSWAHPLLQNATTYYLNS